MKFEFTCTYCGKKWVKEYFYKPDFDGMSCEVCKDKDLIVKNLDKSKIDYYGKE